jgi:cytochrome c-type biogenesis protein CcmH/NrfG
MGAAPRLTLAASADKPAEAALRRDLDSCRAHANVDACYDAIRWNPNDPVLQIALGDALLLTKRPSDALRAYRRAAAVAPATPGIAAKISAAEAKLSSQQKLNRAPHSAPAADASKRFSNTEPEAQSH